MDPRISLWQRIYRWFIYMLLPIGGVASLIASHAAPVQATPVEIQTGCVGGNNTIALSPGTVDRALTFGGLTRRYTLHLPPNYDGRSSLPVVISLHGFAGSNIDQQMWSGFNAIADRENFIAVYPNGTGFPQRWNAGDSPYINLGVAPQSTVGQVDDVAFIGALLDELNRTLCVDTARIYVNGLSNGGGMTNRLACEMADRIAAVGMVAGAYSPLPGGCQPSRPLPVIAFHGDADPIVPYTGDPSLGTPPIPQWAAAWAKRNGCDAAPRMLAAQGEVSGLQYVHCALNAEVILYTVHGGGHTWPGGPSLPFIGKTTNDINASEAMWQFFQAHPLPNRP